MIFPFGQVNSGDRNEPQFALHPLLLSFIILVGLYFNFYSVYAAATPVLVQSNYASVGGKVDSVIVPYSQPQTRGDLNVVIVGWNDAVASIAKVQDSAGNFYRSAAPLACGEHLSQAIYYAFNIHTSSARGINSIQVEFSQQAPFPDIRIFEYSGIDDINPFDTSAVGLGRSSGPIIETTPLIASQQKELVVMGAMTTGYFAKFPADLDQAYSTRMYVRHSNKIGEGMAEGLVIPNAGTYAGRASIFKYPQDWIMQVATFRPKGVMVPPLPPSSPQIWPTPPSSPPPPPSQDYVDAKLPFYRQSYSNSVPSFALFVVDDRVETTAAVNVRVAPALSERILGDERRGAAGRVVAGPEPVMKIGFPDHVWWKINYDNGLSGWSVADFLKYSAIAPTRISKCSGNQ